MRRTGVGVDPKQLATHDHVAWFGEGMGDLLRVASDVFEEGMRCHHRLVLLARSRDLADFRMPELESLVAAGTLQLLDTDALYRDGLADPLETLAAVREMCGAALRDGHSGLRVVADNTELALAQGASTWLAWEELADREQADQQIQGVCYFDATRLDPQLLARLAAVHPLVNVGTHTPGFQLYYDGGWRKLVGEVDHFNARELAACVSSSVLPDDRHLDLSELGFIDHRGIDALYRSLPDGASLVLHGAHPVVRRLVEFLDLPGGRVIVSSSGPGREPPTRTR